MSASQTKRKGSGSIPQVMLKGKFIKFIEDDLSLIAQNQINSLLRRREYTKKYELYNEKIKEVLLDELKKRNIA
jgi:hypothetical protein